MSADTIWIDVSPAEEGCRSTPVESSLGGGTNPVLLTILPFFKSTTLNEFPSTIHATDSFGEATRFVLLPGGNVVLVLTASVRSSRIQISRPLELSIATR